MSTDGAPVELAFSRLAGDGKARGCCSSDRRSALPSPHFGISARTGGAVLAEETERLRLRLRASSAQLARRRRTGLGEAVEA